MAEIEMWDTGWKDMLVDIEAETIQAALNGVNDAGNHLRNETINKVAKGTRTGKLYRRPDKKMHQASAPGEPAKTDSGHLIQNINHSGAQYVNGEVVTRVGVDGKIVKYAARLELGGFHIAKNGRAVYMEKRPFLRPTFEEQRETMIDKIMQQLNR